MDSTSSGPALTADAKIASTPFARCAMSTRCTVEAMTRAGGGRGGDAAAEEGETAEAACARGLYFGVARGGASWPPGASVLRLACG